MENLTETIKENLNRIANLDIVEKIKVILRKVPNKNALYRDLNIVSTYLNIKRFLNNKEHLKERSKRHICDRLNYKRAEIYINYEKISDEDLKVLERLQQTFLDDLNYYAENFNELHKRFDPNDIDDQDKEMLSSALNFANSLSEKEIDEFNNVFESMDDVTNDSNDILEDIKKNVLDKQPEHQKPAISTKVPQIKKRDEEDSIMISF